LIFVDNRLYLDRVIMTGCVKILLAILVIFNAAMAVEIADEAPILLGDGGVIKGVVLNEQGLPLENAKIIVYSSMFNPIDSVITDSNGAFYQYIESGNYYVSAEAFNYSKKYFPSAYLTIGAHPIEVFASREDYIVFELEPGGAISGGILTGVGSPTEFLVSAVKIDFPNQNWQCDRYFPIADHGSYLLDGLLPGYYKVFVRGEGYTTIFYPQMITFENAEFIEVQANDIVGNIDFTLDRPGNGFISGRITEVSTNTPIPGVEVSAYQWSDGGNDPNKTITISNDNGDYELELTAGFYYVAIAVENSLELGNIIRMYYNDCYDPKLASSLQIVPFQIVHGIDFGVDLGNNFNLKITGNIADLETGFPLEGAKLTAVDYQTGRPVSYCQSIYNGDFTIENLLTGTYLIDIGGPGLIPTFWPNCLSWQQAEIIVLTNLNHTAYNGGGITQDYGTPGFSVSGQVVDSEGPLMGARVYAINTFDGKISYSRTNAAGNYNISSGLHEGLYNVFADLYGWNGEFFPSSLLLSLAGETDFENIDFDLSPAILAIDEKEILPDQINLLGNFPNPFNSHTTILLYVPNKLNSDLEIFDIAGRLVTSIPVDFNTGINSVFWNGRSFSNDEVTSGVYFYRIREIAKARKMVLLK